MFHCGNSPIYSPLLVHIAVFYCYFSKNKGIALVHFIISFAFLNKKIKKFIIYSTFITLFVKSNEMPEHVHKAQQYAQILAQKRSAACTRPPIGCEEIPDTQMPSASTPRYVVSTILTDSKYPAEEVNTPSEN